MTHGLRRTARLSEHLHQEKNCRQNEPACGSFGELAPPWVGGRALVRPSRARCPRPLGPPCLWFSPFSAFCAASLYTIYTFCTVHFPRSVSGGFGTNRSFNPLDNGHEVGGRGRPRSRNGARFPHHVLTMRYKVHFTDNWGPTNAANRFFRVKVSMP